MSSIPFTEVMFVIYFLVDEWYQHEGYQLLKGKAGTKPEFSDSEMMTLMLAQDFIPYPGENQYIGYMRANYLDLFPKLLTQSQDNRRARHLRLLVEAFRRHWLHELGVLTNHDLLLDTKPVPVMGYKRSKKHSDFAGSAGDGVCVSRNLKYYGYKLVTLSTLEGLPLVYDLVAANLDERVAAQAVVYTVRGWRIMLTRGSAGKSGNTHFSNIPGIACIPPNASTKLSKIRPNLTVGSIVFANELKGSSTKSKIPGETGNVYGRKPCLA